MRTAPSNRGGCGEVSGKAADLSDTPADRSNQLLSDERKARERCRVAAKLCQWLLDLSGRIEQQKVEIVHGDFSGDPRALKAEFERLKLAIKLYKESGR